jgi:hypothetical protein
MADDPNPKYEALPRKDGGGWYVVVSPPKHVTTLDVHGFVSEAEADP